VPSLRSVVGGLRAGPMDSAALLSASSENVVFSNLARFAVLTARNKCRLSVLSTDTCTTLLRGGHYALQVIVDGNFLTDMNNFVPL